MVVVTAACMAMTKQADGAHEGLAEEPGVSRLTDEGVLGSHRYREVIVRPLHQQVQVLVDVGRPIRDP